MVYGYRVFGYLRICLQDAVLFGLQHFHVFLLSIFTNYVYHGYIFFRFLIGFGCACAIKPSVVVSSVLCIKWIQVHSAQRSTMSSSTRAYGPWKTGAPASWQSGGPWKTPKLTILPEPVILGNGTHLSIILHPGGQWKTMTNKAT